MTCTDRDGAAAYPSLYAGLRNRDSGKGRKRPATNVEDVGAAGDVG